MDEGLSITRDGLTIAKASRRDDRPGGLPGHEKPRACGAYSKPFAYTLSLWTITMPRMPPTPVPCTVHWKW